VVAKPRVVAKTDQLPPLALDRLYAERFPEEQRAAKAELWRVLYDAFFAAYVPPDATVVDLGAGYCDLINAVRAPRRIAVDLNPDTPGFAAPGVEVLALPIERLADRIAPSSVDVVFASNVLEHLPGSDALLAVLGGVRRVLRPHGRLVIVQPNVRVLGGAFWDFFDHTLPLSEKGMSEALLLAGFRITECRARFLPYTTKSRLPQSSLLVRAYVRVRLAQWLFGKQMLVVAEPAD
jgi:SAM-dependent methyltransferase